MKELKKIHGENTYDYSHVVYINMWTKVKIICPKHGVFLQNPAKHIKTGKSGYQGCPKCKFEKQKQTNLDRYGVDNPMKVKEFTDKNWDAKKINGTCQSSGPEDKMYNVLVNFFGENNVYRQYNTDPRYPFACDFYIKSEDLFIALNGTWFHGEHWFDENNIEDINKLEFWESKFLDGHVAYGQAIKTWPIVDPLKRDTASKNNLNYLVFWKNDLSDFYEWFNKNYSSNIKQINTKTKNECFDDVGRSELTSDNFTKIIQNPFDCFGKFEDK